MSNISQLIDIIVSGVVQLFIVKTLNFKQVLHYSNIYPDYRKDFLNKFFTEYFKYTNEIDPEIIELISDAEYADIIKEVAAKSNNPSVLALIRQSSLQS